MLAIEYTRASGKNDLLAPVSLGVSMSEILLQDTDPFRERLARQSTAISAEFSDAQFVGDSSELRRCWGRVAPKAAAIAGTQFLFDPGSLRELFGHTS